MPKNLPGYSSDLSNEVRPFFVFSARIYVEIQGVAMQFNVHVTVGLDSKLHTKLYSCDQIIMSNNNGVDRVKFDY